MQLWRIDAQHERDGALTLLRSSLWEAEVQASLLSVCGWFTDIVPVETPAFGERMVHCLTHCTWPVAPLREIIELAQRTAHPASLPAFDPDEQVALVE
jgi:hypothetical protein